MAELRISNADRERATADLARHYADGRLEHEEYDERLDAIWTARTHADLAMLFHDLPALAPAAPPAPVRDYRRPPGSRLPFAMLLIGGLLAVVLLTELPWWVWAIVAWVLVAKVWRPGRRMHGMRHGGCHGAARGPRPS